MRGEEAHGQQATEHYVTRRTQVHAPSSTSACLGSGSTPRSRPLARLQGSRRRRAEPTAPQSAAGNARNAPQHACEVTDAWQAPSAGLAASHTADAETLRVHDFGRGQVSRRS